MKINKELQDKIQELNLTEQNLQNFLLQKQAFQFELNETDSALEEAKKSGGDIYKIVSQIMLKTKKEDIVKELSEKKEVLALRIKTIENQEKILKEKAQTLREGIENSFKSKKNQQKE